MQHRNHLSNKERHSISRLIKLLRTKTILQGGLVTMSRTCGQSGCKCYRGEKHVSIYLSARNGKKRKMIYIPPPLETMVNEWVKTWKEMEKLLSEVSSESMKRLLNKKES